MGDALLLFPEELWGKLIQQLQDSHDIVNVVKAYPELEPVLDKRRPLWLIDQLIPWLDRKAILSCRQVCKRWSHSIDNFLEKSPSSRGIYYKGITFKTTASIQEFLQDMSSNTSTSLNGNNPFVGRSLALFPATGEWENQHLTFKDVWNATSDLLRLFGQHLHFIQISHFGCIDGYQLSQSVVESLKQLPNLKELSLSGKFYSCRKSHKKKASMSMPALITYLESQTESFQQPVVVPNLETLLLENPDLPHPLVHFLASSFSTQIRKLSIDTRHWKHEYSNLFPNLRELTLFNIGSKSYLTHLLLSFEAPHLSVLHLRSWGLEDANFITENDLFSWLGRFPQMENLDLALFPAIVSRPEMKSSHPNPSLLAVDTFSSVKTLSIRLDSPEQLNYGLLPYFPSLENFNCFNMEFPRSACKENYLGGVDMYDADVWKLSPKLKVISVNGSDFRTSYTRDIYDYLKRMREPTGSG